MPDAHVLPNRVRHHALPRKVGLTWVVLSVAVFSSWPQASGADSGVDDLLSSAERQADAALSQAQRQLSHADCAGAETPQGLLAFSARISSTPLRSEFIRPALADLFRYYSYHALNDRDPERCAPLQVVTREGRYAPPWEDKLWPADRYCRRIYHELSFARALLSEPENFPGVCAAQLAYEVSLPPEKAAAVCEFWAKNYRHPSRACRRFDFYRMREDDPLRKCDILMRAYSGDARGCPALTCPSERIPEIEYPDGENHYEVREKCRAIAAFARAFPARDPSACGGEEMCSAMMGQASSLAQRRGERIKAKACAMIAAHHHSRPLRDYLSETTRDYEKEIQDIERILRKVEATPGTAERGMRLARLRRKMSEGLPRRVNSALIAMPTPKLPD